MPEGYFILADAGPSGYFILCAALMVVLQLVALVCGIVGWRTASGKAGIAISIVSLALVVLAVWSLITTTHSEKSAPTTTVTDTVQSSPTVTLARARCRYRTKARREKYAPTGRSTPRRKAGRRPHPPNWPIFFPNCPRNTPRTCSATKSRASKTWTLRSGQSTSTTAPPNSG